MQNNNNFQNDNNNNFQNINNNANNLNHKNKNIYYNKNNNISNEIKNANNNHQNNNNYSFSKYNKATQTVLLNFRDNISYLNSVLQLLGNIHIFAKFFLNPKNPKNLKYYPLSFVTYRLFYHLYPFPYPEERTEYKADSFLKVLGTLNLVYKTKHSRNPNDLLSFILNTLHKELNISKNKDININQNLNQYSNNKNKYISLVIKNIINTNESIIFNIFNWFEIKESKCSQCNISKYNLNTFNTFELDISGTYNKKHNSITLDDCLRFYEESKNKNLFCINCGKNNITINNSKIFASPNIFIFLLNREQKNDFINIKFIIDEKIDLTSFIEQNIYKEYKLTSIISLLKNQKDEYVCFCKSPFDQKWYSYQNNMINSIEKDKILKDHNDDDNYYYIPCILVYNLDNKQ